MWAIHLEDETILTALDLNDPAIRAACESDPGVVAIAHYDPTMPDLDMEREARYCAGLHID